MNRRYCGFTLFEILLVLGIALAAGLVALTFSIPQLQAGQTESILNDLESLTSLYQQHAYSGKENKSYGVHFDSNAYTMFVGESYAGAESAYTVYLPADTSIITISLNDGGSEVVFSSGNLIPSTYGFVRFSNGIDTFILEVNGAGLVESYKE